MLHATHSILLSECRGRHAFTDCFYTINLQMLCAYFSNIKTDKWHIKGREWRDNKCRCLHTEAKGFVSLSVSVLPSLWGTCKSDTKRLRSQPLLFSWLCKRFDLLPFRPTLNRWNHHAADSRHIVQECLRGIQECSWECSVLLQQLELRLSRMRSFSLLKVGMHMHSSASVYICCMCLHMSLCVVNLGCYWKTNFGLTS